jgi:hypothetical protein
MGTKKSLAGKTGKARINSRYIQLLDNGSNTA